MMIIPSLLSCLVLSYSVLATTFKHTARWSNNSILYAEIVMKSIGIRYRARMFIIIPKC